MSWQTWHENRACFLLQWQSLSVIIFHLISEMSIYKVVSYKLLIMIPLKSFKRQISDEGFIFVFFPSSGKACLFCIKMVW
jgi:hypothetical protein